MKPNKFLIVVPARSVTANQNLMARLAAQMAFIKGKKVRMIIMPESEEPPVTKPAELVRNELQKIEIEPQLETRSFAFEDKSQSVSREKAKVVLDKALNPALDAETLIIVIDLSYAEKLGRVFMIDYLKAEGLNPNIIGQVLKPGEAGIVNCEEQIMDCLHPEGSEAWAIKAMA